MTAPGRGPSGRNQAMPSAFRGAALVFVAVVVGIIGLQILDDTGGGSSASSISEPTSSTAAGQAPKAHENRSDVTIKVYNASDVQGAAQSLTDKFKGFGYATLPVATSSTTRKGTVVQCREGFEGDGVAIAVFGIGNNATSEPFPSDAPDGADDADCIVILGTA
jgi:hypothetical protein